MKRRRFTKRFYRKVAGYYQANGWSATAKRFRISGSTMQRMLAQVTDEPKAETPTGRSLYLAAKALERALMEHRKAGNPSSDIEHYAFFLLKEILK